MNEHNHGGICPKCAEIAERVAKVEAAAWVVVDASKAMMVDAIWALYRALGGHAARALLGERRPESDGASQMEAEQVLDAYPPDDVPGPRLRPNFVPESDDALRAAQADLLARAQRPADDSELHSGGVADNRRPEGGGGGG